MSENIHENIFEIGENKSKSGVETAGAGSKSLNKRIREHCSTSSGGKGTSLTLLTSDSESSPTCASGKLG